MATVNRYDPGNVVILSTEFRLKSTKELANPTTVGLKVIKPNGQILTLTPTNVSTGKYQYELLVAEEGLWQVNWEGTGAVVAADQDRFIVNQSGFVP